MIGVGADVLIRIVSVSNHVFKKGRKIKNEKKVNVCWKVTVQTVSRFSQKIVRYDHLGIQRQSHEIYRPWLCQDLGWCILVDYILSQSIIWLVKSFNWASSSDR